MSAIVTSGLPLIRNRSAAPGLPTQAFAALAAAWRRHRAMQALEALDDRGLADIGVSPGEIEAVVRTGRRDLGAAARTRAQPALPPAWTEWR